MGIQNTRNKRFQTLYRKYRDREWIPDDESYFTKTHSTINENDNFYSDKIDFAPAEVKLMWDFKAINHGKWGCS